VNVRCSGSEEVDRRSDNVAGAKGAGDANKDKIVEAAAYLEKFGEWTGEAGDLAPLAIANVLNLKINIVVVKDTKDEDGKLVTWEKIDRRKIFCNAAAEIKAAKARGDRIDPDMRKLYNEITVYYNGSHYDAHINNERVPIIGDGNCAFRAVLASLYQSNADDKAVRDLRSRVAAELLENWQQYEGFLPNTEN
jgi:hypothetical protein